MRKGIKNDDDTVDDAEKKGDEKKNKKAKCQTDDYCCVNENDGKRKKRKALSEEEGDENDGPALKKSSLLSKRERVKTTCTVSARMKQVVDQMVLSTREQYNIAMQQTTVFAFKSQQSEIVSCFLEEMRRENPPLMQNKASLLQLIDDAYERSQSLIMLHTVALP